ncbi:MAG: OmpA family protein [Runella zeae]
MYSYLLSLIALFSEPQQTTQVNNTVGIYGSCRDNTTKDFLKNSAVYAGFKTVKQLLGQCDATGKWDFRIPDSTQYLSFEVKGYHTVTYPIHFVGKVSSAAKFPLFVEMSEKDSLPLAVPTLHMYRFEVVDSLDLEHRLYIVNTTRYGMFYTNKNDYKRFPVVPLPYEEGKYVYRAFTKTGKVVLKRELTILPGVNFLEMTIQDNEVKDAVVELDESRVKSLKTRSLYFKQSSHDLMEQTQMALDSVARFLTNEKDRKALITGYTDGVGERSKNMILSEYRAKRVKSYLLENGVAPQQLEIEWTGSS